MQLPEKVMIKPLSVNEAWQGRRYKTEKYKSYERELLLLLPKIKPIEPPYALFITIGVSSPLFDLDNALKCFLDILQKKYGINDRDIFRIDIEKDIVKKKSEFIQFRIFNHKVNYPPTAEPMGCGKLTNIKQL